MLAKVVQVFFRVVFQSLGAEPATMGFRAASVGP